MKDKSNTELKPCPFCGDTHLDGGAFSTGDGYAILCGNPSCQVEMLAKTKESVIRKWNTRTPQDAAMRHKDERLARKFHEAYERLAPQYGYKTREETRHFDPNSENGKLMIAVAREINLSIPPQDAAMRKALEDIANMPEIDQDDAHRLRHKAKQALSTEQPDSSDQLVEALVKITERFKEKMTLHKDDCFAYQVAREALAAYRRD